MQDDRRHFGAGMRIRCACHGMDAHQNNRDNHQGRKHPRYHLGPEIPGSLFTHGERLAPGVRRAQFPGTARDHVRALQLARLRPPTPAVQQRRGTARFGPTSCNTRGTKGDIRDQHRRADSHLDQRISRSGQFSRTVQEGFPS